MRVFATFNIKGGVGKTSTCTTLAYLAAAEGLRTLVWDLDPQGAAAWIYRVGAVDPLRGPLGPAAVCASDHENLDVLPPLETEGRHNGAGPLRPAEVLSTLRRDYDAVFIDAAPALSPLAEGVFEVADALIAPTIPTPLALRTLARLLLHLKQRSPRPRVLPFFTMVDRRKALHRQVAEYAEAEHLGFLASEIPYSSAVERMSVLRRPLHAFAGGDRAARAYRELWAEVRARMSAKEPDEGELPSRERVAALLSEVRSAAGPR
jgi:cellulose biosynthesis protein BcsQ